MRLPYELQIESPVSQRENASAHWMLGRGLTSNLECDVTSGLAFAKIERKLTEVAHLCESHRAHALGANACHATLKAAVSDNRWNTLVDTNHIELAQRRAELLVPQEDMRTGGGQPAFRPLSDREGAAISVQTVSGPSSIEESHLIAADSRRGHRFWCRDQLGAKSVGGH